MFQSAGRLIFSLKYFSPRNSTGASNFGSAFVPLFSASEMRPLPWPMRRSNNPSPLKSAACGATGMPSVSRFPKRIMFASGSSVPGFQLPGLRYTPIVPLLSPAIVGDEQIGRAFVVPMEECDLGDAVWVGPEAAIIGHVLRDLRRKERDYLRIGEFRLRLRPAVDIGAQDARRIGRDQIGQSIAIHIHEAHGNRHLLSAHPSRLRRGVGAAAK